MVRRNDVFEVADEIRAEKQSRVNQREVIARLIARHGKAGSPRDIGPILLEWIAERTYAPAFELSGIPTALAELAAKNAASIWKAAQAEAALALEHDRRRWEVQLRDEQAARDEALGLADRYKAEAEREREAKGAPEKFIAELTVKLESAKRQLSDLRKEHFCERLMAAIFDVLHGDVELRLADVERLLDPGLLEEAGELWGAWPTKLMRQKIDTKISNRKLFAKAGPGLYRRRRPGDDR